MLPTAVMVLSTPSADRAWRHRTQCAAYTALQSGRGDTSLCAPYARDRPGDSLSLRARAVDPQSRRNVAAILGRPISAETVSQVAKTLYRHGLTGEGLDSGLLAALPIVLHGIPVQRCWLTRSGTFKTKSARPTSPTSSAHSTRSCMPTINLPHPRPLVSSPIASRKGYPNAVACLRDDLDELLTCFRYKSEEQRRRYEPQRHRTTLPRSPATD